MSLYGIHFLKASMAWIIKYVQKWYFLLTTSFKISLWTTVRHLDLGLIWLGWCLAVCIKNNVREEITRRARSAVWAVQTRASTRFRILTWWWNDGPVSNNDDGLIINWFKMFLNESTNLSESSMWSVWDTNEEILTSWTIGFLVINVLHTVDKDDFKILLFLLVFGLELMELFCYFFFEISWFNSFFLDYLFSSIEHVW